MRIREKEIDWTYRLDIDRLNERESIEIAMRGRQTESVRETDRQTDRQTGKEGSQSNR